MRYSASQSALANTYSRYLVQNQIEHIDPDEGVGILAEDRNADARPILSVAPFCGMMGFIRRSDVVLRAHLRCGDNFKWVLKS